MTPSVAAAILTWNKCGDVQPLLDDVGSPAVASSRVYVVDNGSRDRTVDAIRSRHPSARLLVIGDNKGGSGGFNLGLRAVLEVGSYDYVCLINNDVRLDPLALKGLLVACTVEADAGIAGSLIRNRARPDVVVEPGRDSRVAADYSIRESVI